jgi:hypothetical protein
MSGATRFLTGNHCAPARAACAGNLRASRGRDRGSTAVAERVALMLMIVSTASRSPVARRRQSPNHRATRPATSRPDQSTAFGTPSL